MGKNLASMFKRVTRAGRTAMERAETEFFAAQGRKAVHAKVATAKAISKKAVKTGLVVGAIGAAAVVARETRKRRALG